MEDREERRELDGFDRMVLQRIGEEKTSWQPVPPGISERTVHERMKRRDGDRILMVLAFVASLSWVLLGGISAAILLKVSPWLTFAICIVVYSMLLSILYMFLVLVKRRKRKVVSF